MVVINFKYQKLAKNGAQIPGRPQILQHRLFATRLKEKKKKKEMTEALVDLWAI